MLSETLTTGLERYGIGAKIRTLRQKKKLSLVELGAHSGLSPAMLSKIERGHLFPTLPTLLRIALVFGVGLEHFFAEVEKHRSWTVVRKKDRLRLPDKPGASPPSYLFESLDFPVIDRLAQVYYAEFRVDSKPSEPHRHAGAELIYVIRGELAVVIDGDDILLRPGDTLCFDSGQPHSYRREGRSACEVVVVTTPRLN